MCVGFVPQVCASNIYVEYVPLMCDENGYQLLASMSPREKQDHAAGRLAQQLQPSQSGLLSSPIGPYQAPGKM